MIQTNLQGLGTFGHPGVFMGQIKSLGLTNHIDIPYVTALAPEKPIDFGVLDLWALKQRANSPLLSISVENAQVIYSNADYYEFSLPSAADMTNRLVSGGLDKDRFGMDGEEIPFIVTKRDLSPGSVFKFDLSSRFSFTVVERRIEQVGEHYKLWARLNTNPFVPYVTKAEFQPQRQIIKLGDLRGLDFSSFKGTWEISKMPSMMKFKNYLTNVKVQTHYRVSSGAVEYLHGGHRFDGQQLKFMEQAALQFYAVRGIADNKFIDMTELKKQGGGQEYQAYAKRIADERAQGNGEAALINFLDALAVDILQRQGNDMMIWSDGIDQIVDGYDSKRLIPGLWFQLDMSGYKTSYNVETFSLDTITDAIKDYEFGKVPLREWVSTNVFLVRTGRGGQQLIYQEFIKKGFSIPGIIQNGDHGFIEGQANNLKYKAPRFVEFQVPGIGILLVEWEPGFDPINADEFVNPTMPSGYRLSSYTFLIEDYNTSRNNIAIVRKTGSRTRMRVQAGDETHPYLRSGKNISGQNIQVHASTDDLSGYEVSFDSNVDSAIAKDPTKLLKIAAINPRTGLANL